MAGIARSEGATADKSEAKAIAAFEGLIAFFAATEGVSAGKLFGKSCLKADGKAFLAQQGGLVVFKLTGDDHARAMKMKGAALWDPSGKGRPMKEWVAAPAPPPKTAQGLAQAALDYARGA